MEEISNSIVEELGAHHREYEIKFVNGQWRIIEKDGIVDMSFDTWLIKAGESTFTSIIIGYESEIDELTEQLETE